MRKERARGDLAVKLGAPATRNLVRASRTTAFGGQIVASYLIPVTANQSLVTLRTASVFPGSHHAGEIAGVDVTEPGLLADFGGAQQVFNCGVALIISLHFVVRVKCGDVPRDVG